MAGAAECGEFFTVRPCSWATSGPASSSSRLFASLGVTCAGKPFRTCSVRGWAWRSSIEVVFSRSGPGTTEHRRCRCQEALREAGFLHMHRPHLGPPDYVRPEPRQARNETCWALLRIPGGFGSRTGMKITQVTETLLCKFPLEFDLPLRSGPKGQPINPLNPRTGAVGDCMFCMKALTVNLLGFHGMVVYMAGPYEQCASAITKRGTSPSYLLPHMGGDKSRGPCAILIQLCLALGKVQHG